MPASPCWPGSLQYGVSIRIIAWIDTSTCSNVDTWGSQLGPAQVPSSDRQTLPFAYRFGLMRLPHAQ